MPFPPLHLRQTKSRTEGDSGTVFSFARDQVTCVAAPPGRGCDITDDLSLGADGPNRGSADGSGITSQRNAALQRQAR